MDNERTYLNLETQPYMWLKLEFDRLQRKNRRYSLRAFATNLGIPSGRLSEYLSNKRQITPAAAEQIAQSLKLTPDLTRQFLECVELYRERKRKFKNNLTQLTQTPEFKLLDTVDQQDFFSFIVEGHYFAIIDLFADRYFQSSTEWIAKKINISEPLLISSLKKLERLQLIDRTAPDWKVLLPNFLNIPKKKFKNIEALFSNDIHTKEMILLDESQIKIANELIHDLKTKFIELSKSGQNKNEPYELSIDLLPVKENKI